MQSMGTTDAGYPLHLVLFSNDGKFDPRRWQSGNKVVILINNGIHPGEPDGIDASMMFARDLLKANQIPNNVVICIIPVYNIDRIEEYKPDFIIIFPWNLKKEIVEQLNYVKNWGGQFVVAVPGLQIFE